MVGQGLLVEWVCQQPKPASKEVAMCYPCCIWVDCTGTLQGVCPAWRLEAEAGARIFVCSKGLHVIVVQPESADAGNPPERKEAA